MRYWRRFCMLLPFKICVLCLYTFSHVSCAPESVSISNFFLKWSCWTFDRNCYNSTWIFNASSNFLSTLYSKLPWPNIEVCDDTWVKLNVTRLNSWFQDSLYGQHLVHSVVSKSLENHLIRKISTKALVMSFHGNTGTGKNYVTQELINSLYKKGSQSHFVHWYYGSLDFPYMDEVKKYHIRLLEEIPRFARLCEQSLFIFDEVDKMPAGVIDILKPFLSRYTDVDGTDYRKSIFIFLSSSGESAISKKALNFWLDGKDREDIIMTDLQPFVHEAAFTEVGGLQKSEIMMKDLIDAYIPFLPLEKRHVKMCITEELKIRGWPINENAVEHVADQLNYYPTEFELFSESGCKTVSYKVGIYGKV